MGELRQKMQERALRQAAERRHELERRIEHLGAALREIADPETIWRDEYGRRIKNPIPAMRRRARAALSREDEGDD